MPSLALFIPLCAGFVLVAIVLLIRDWARDPVRIDTAAYDQAVTAARSRRERSTARLPR